MTPDAGQATPLTRSVERVAKTRVLLICFVAGCGVAVSAAVYQAIKGHERRAVAAQFMRDASQCAQSIQLGMTQNTETILALKAFFNSLTHVDRDTFGAFARQLLSTHPHTEALEWVPRVTADEREAFEKQLSELDGVPDSSIKELDAQGGLVAAGQRPQYFPVQYVEPIERNRVALGFDHGFSRATIKGDAGR